jgi:hypothetical protein
MGLDERPSALSENNNGDSATCQILLIAEIFVGGHEDIEPCGLRLVQEITITQFLPAAGAGFGYGVVADEVASQSARCSVIEQNEHLTTGDIWFSALRDELKNRLDLFAGHAELIDKFIDVHVLEILKYSRNGHPRSSKDPCSASFAGDAFNSRAL